MLTSNPFAELSASVSPAMMKTYVVIMILFVVGGTLFDIWHKKSAKYFFSNWRKAQDKGTKEIGGGGVAGLAIQTAASEVLTSSEFCNPKRRIAHLLTMYGFIAYAIATFVMVFWYTAPGSSTPFIWPLLWTLGALSVCVGGYWFWFVIRADVSAEGHPPWRLIRADLFILSLLASVTFGLLWAWTQSTVLLALYLMATTLLFGSVPWSKFSHMFFKPAAALQKRVANANGSRNNLPPPADKPAVFGSVERQPSHY
ncbi:MAG: adenylyl-sulfate reductase [Geminicoccaceae bacterium]